VPADRTPPNEDLPENTGDDPLPNSAADDFFIKMNRDFRRPKPSEEAVAAALHAIQTLAGEAAEQDVEETSISYPVVEGSPSRADEKTCPKCGDRNSAANRFCGTCGSTLSRGGKLAAKTAPSVPQQPRREEPTREQHIHHHHHHYFPGSGGKPPQFGDGGSALSGELAAPGMTDAAAAQSGVQNLVRDWTLACNLKQLDHLLALYSPDAIVLRANAAPAHGHPAIREVLKAALEAGLGDVELTPADAGILGDIACLTGTSRMLVPTAPGKRREETGKFLIVARRENGAWKILADSWCIDVFPKPATDPTPPTPVVRAPRE